MQQYLELLQHVLDNGVEREDRTGTGTLSVFGYQMRFDLQKGFPLLTTKALHTKSIIHELLWMLGGSTNVYDLQKHGVNIWDEWANSVGELGPVYGKQWRKWETDCEYDPHGGYHFEYVDQIEQLISGLKKNPSSRRHVVSAWNVGDIDDMALPPCHCLFQFYVAEGKLSCQLYQRSGDVFLGVPFNIASYALLTHMIAQVVGLEVGEFVHTFGDAHLYLNHVEQAKDQLMRKPDTLPTLWLNPDVRDIDAFTYDDVKFLGYSPQPHIKAEVSV